jgi:hypothetical protein
MDYLKATDRKDLLEYLRTGKSQNYEEQQIIGVWKLDKGAVVTLIRKAKPDIRSKELRLIKAALEAVPDVSLMATPDNKVLIRGGGDAPAPAAEQQPQTPPGVDPALAARYGPEYARNMARMQGGQVPPPVTNKPPETVASPVPAIKEGEGTWGEENGQLFVTLDAAGRQVRANARIAGDEMVLNLPGASLVFAKQ